MALVRWTFFKYSHVSNTQANSAFVLLLDWLKNKFSSVYREAYISNKWFKRPIVSPLLLTASRSTFIEETRHFFMVLITSLHITHHVYNMACFYEALTDQIEVTKVRISLPHEIIYFCSALCKLRLKKPSII